MGAPTCTPVPTLIDLGLGWSCLVPERRNHTYGPFGWVMWDGRDGGRGRERRFDRHSFRRTPPALRKMHRDYSEEHFVSRIISEILEQVPGEIGASLFVLTVTKRRRYGHGQ